VILVTKLPATQDFNERTDSRPWLLGSQARTAYPDFFSLWKDVDSDIPILVVAKADYAKLN